MDVGYFTICGGVFYGTVAVILYTFVYWIEVVLGKCSLYLKKTYL